MELGGRHRPEYRRRRQLDERLGEGRLPRGAGTGRTTLSLPQAAGHSQVRVRWHYTGDHSLWWELDNVFLGNRSCDPIHGGLLTGQVSDANTHQGVDGANVFVGGQETAAVTTEPTPDDPNRGDGFYALFYPGSGSHPVTATMADYVSVQHNVTVAVDAVTPATFSLPAGQLAVSTPTVAVTSRMGSSTTATVKVTNTGTATATADVSEEPGTFTQQTGAPRELVRGRYSLRSHARMAARAVAHPAGIASDQPWAPIADYPNQIMDESLVTDPNTGKVYSIGGFDGTGRHRRRLRVRPEHPGVDRDRPDALRP